jgi:capsid protein
MTAHRAAFQAKYTFAILEETFFNKVYEWFISHEVDFKGLKMPNFEQDKARYLACSWSRPKTEWVDPLKDTKAAEGEFRLGINTLTELAEISGRDIEELVATRKYEKELFENAGLGYSGSDGMTQASDASNTDEQEQ